MYLREHPAGRRVGDERVPDTGLGELPRGQSGTLEVGPGLVDEDVHLATLVDGDLDDPEGRAELPAGERARVAVGEQSEGSLRGRRQLGQGEGRQALVILGRLADDVLGLAPDRVGDDLPLGVDVTHGIHGPEDAVDRPAHVGGRRARVDQGRPEPRIAARRTKGVEATILSAVSDRPIAAAWPIAGAPRTTISRIAQATSPAVVQRISTPARAGAGAAPTARGRLQRGRQGVRRDRARRLPAALWNSLMIDFTSP